MPTIEGISAMKSLQIIVPLLLAFGSAAVANSDHPEPDKGSVKAMLELTAHGTGVDFEPLNGPEEALQASDLIVVGTLVDVIEGVRIKERKSRIFAVPDADKLSPDPLIKADSGAKLVSSDKSRGTRYLSYVIAVDRVLWPHNAKVPDTIEVQVLSNTLVTAAEVALLNTGPRVLAGLDRVVSMPVGESTVALKANGELEKSELYYPFTDLFWFDSPTGMISHHVDRAARSPGWRDSSRFVDQLADSLGNFIDKDKIKTSGRKSAIPKGAAATTK